MKYLYSRIFLNKFSSLQFSYGTPPGKCFPMNTYFWYTQIKPYTRSRKEQKNSNRDSAKISNVNVAFYNKVLHFNLAMLHLFIYLKGTNSFKERRVSNCVSEKRNPEPSEIPRLRTQRGPRTLCEFIIASSVLNQFHCANQYLSFHQQRYCKRVFSFEKEVTLFLFSIF